MLSFRTTKCISRLIKLSKSITTANLLLQYQNPACYTCFLLQKLYMYIPRLAPLGIAVKKGREVALIFAKFISYISNPKLDFLCKIMKTINLS